MVSKARQLAQKAGVPSGRRNLIINGAMQVAQRATSTTFDSSNTGYLALDRFSFYTNTTAAFTVSQSTDTPDGFAKSMKLDCTTADTSIAASHRAEFTTSLEGQNLQHFNFGSSSAKTLTISFWVKSSITGDYAVSLYQGDEAGRRTQSQAYTVNVADTWEKKTITYSGDTSGQINDDNGAGLTIRFGLAVGSDYAGTVDNSWGSYTSDNTRLLAGHVANIASSTSNNFYITGIQFEVSTVATDFEHRSYGEELQLCQRYFEYASERQIHAHPVWFYSATGASTRLYFVVPKRTDSYTVGYAGTIGTGSSDHRLYYSLAYRAFTSMTFSSSGKALKSIRVDFNSVTGGSAGGAAGYYNNGTSTIASHIYVDDEL